MDSGIITEIIDEMIQACVIVANASEQSIFSSYDEGTVDEDEDNVSNFGDEADFLIDQFDALDNEETSEKSDDMRIIGKECVEADNSKAETGDNNNSKCRGDAQPDDKVENVAMAAEASLRLKGYATRVFGRFRIVVNLPLMATASKVPQYEIECVGFPIRMMENELVPLFEKFGEVYKVTRNTSTNLITVMYTSPKDAQNAIRSLHRSIVQGHTVQVSKGMQNSRLIVRHIPKSATKKELFEKFGKLTYDLQSVKVYNDKENGSQNRGFCYLDYGDHEKAIAAKKTLSTKNLFGMSSIVEWPNRRFVWDEVQDTLYINNLRSTIRTEDLRKFFSVYGELVSVSKLGSFGKVQFSDAEDAVRAAQEIDKSQLGNENVFISYGTTLLAQTKPQRESGLSDTLYINNLSANLSATDLRKIFHRYGIVTEVEKDGDSASVRFKNPENPHHAARYIDKKQLGIDVQFSFVKPEKTFPKKYSQPVETLYMRNLRSGMAASDLRKYFSVFGEVMEIYKNDDSASVRFRNSENAEHAARDIDKRLLGDKVVISFAENSNTQKKLPVVSDTLYINNMYENMTALRLRKLFSVYGEVIEIDKNGDSAAAKFGNGDHAKRAAQEINQIHLIVFHLKQQNVGINLAGNHHKTIIRTVHD